MPGWFCPFRSRLRRMSSSSIVPLPATIGPTRPLPSEMAFGADGFPLLARARRGRRHRARSRRATCHSCALADLDRRPHDGVLDAAVLRALAFVGPDRARLEVQTLVRPGIASRLPVSSGTHQLWFMSAAFSSSDRTVDREVERVERDGAVRVAVEPVELVRVHLDGEDVRRACGSASTSVALTSVKAASPRG